MLRQSDFFPEEKLASVLNADRGFLATQKELDDYKSLFERSEKWLNVVGVTAETIASEKKLLDANREDFTKNKKEFKRIFIKDADRTFRTTANRVTLMHVLTIMEERNGGYHQAMALVSGLLLLTLEPEETLALLTVLSTNEKYIPQFWFAESIACATDGYVLHDNLLPTTNPTVLAHLKQTYILPETYVTKWFCALTIHVLPFKQAYEFFDGFISEGYTFYFRFACSFMDQLQPLITATVAQNEIYQLLRLDIEHNGVTDELTEAIMKEENLNKHTDDIISVLKNVSELRKTAYDKNLKARMEAANAAHAEREKPKDAGEKCSFCSEEEGEYWCVDCKVYICDTCRDDEEMTKKKGHDEDECMVVDLEDKEWAEEERAAELAEAAAATAGDAVDALTDAVEKLEVE